MPPPPGRPTRAQGRREPHALAATALALLASCGTTRSGHYWGETATLLPGGKALGRAARDAALDPWTWAPLGGAAVLAVGGLDHELSDWARDHTPVFGSQEDAVSASHDLPRWGDGLWYASMLATPSGESLGVWIPNKLKGAAVEWAATFATSELTSALKSAADRERPDGSDRRSFPSGHASSAFATASLTWRNIDAIEMPEALRWTLGTGVFTLAAGTAWARVEAGRHYPTDVLAGAALGNFVARFVHDAFLGPTGPARLSVYADPVRGEWALGVAWSW